MNDTVLYEELINDPLQLYYRNPDTGVWQPDNEIARLLNAEIFPTQVRVPLETLVEYFIRSGLWLKLNQHEQSDARLLWSIFHQPHLKSIDVFSPVLDEVWDALIEGELMTSAHKTHIQDYGTKIMSRAHQLGLIRVEYWDVGRVLNHNHKGRE